MFVCKIEIQQVFNRSENVIDDFQTLSNQICSVSWSMENAHKFWSEKVTWSFDFGKKNFQWISTIFMYHVYILIMGISRCIYTIFLWFLSLKTVWVYIHIYSKEDWWMIYTHKLKMTVGSGQEI